MRILPLVSSPSLHTTAKALVDDMQAENILKIVDRLGGPRPAGSADALKAAQLISKEAQANGWEAKVEPIQTRSGTMYNVVAERKGTAPDNERKLVLAGAHLDSVPGVYGANDDASGAATLLEATRAFSKIPTKDDLRFVWFDGEELGLVGSVAYVKAHKPELEGKAKAMVVAEMMGSPKGSSYLVTTHKTAAVSLIEATKNAAMQIGIKPEVEADPYAGSDHIPFERMGIPSYVVSSAIPRRMNTEDPNYHRKSDTPDKLNKDVLEKAGDLFAVAVLSAAQ